MLRPLKSNRNWLYREKNALTPTLSHPMGEGEHIPLVEPMRRLVSKRHDELATRGATFSLSHRMGEG
jgi:hypothetical protein